MPTLPQSRNHLVFWNVAGIPDTIDDLLRIKADTRTCLGNLVSSSHDDEEEVRNSVYSLSIAKYYGCHLLKGENEKGCISQKIFSHYMIKDELKTLSTSREIDGLVFLSHLPILPTSDDEKLMQEKLKRLGKSINRLTDRELSETYGKLISRNLDYLQHLHPKGEFFFVGGRSECAVWQRYGSTAIVNGVYEILGDERGLKELEPARSSTSLVSPGDVDDGYFCILTMPEKKLTFYKI